MIPRLLPALCAVLMATLLAPPAFSARGPVAELNAYLSATRTWEADFTQSVYDENGRLRESARGRVSIRRPGEFRWDYEGESGQLIVADGSKVWLYDRELEQVTVRPLDKALGSSPAVLLTRMEGVGDRFQVTSLGERDGLDWLELRPRSDEAGFDEIRLGFGGASAERQIRKMELRDAFGQTIELSFTRSRENIPLDDALFRFVPPGGVDVIEAR